MKDRFVFDTNVLVSAVLSPRSTAALSLKIAFDRGTLFVSKETWHEFESVLGRDKFDKYFSVQDREIIKKLLWAKVVEVEVKSTFSVCTDPKDDIFLQLAVDSSADIIVSGDNDLLVLNPFGNIRILTPSEFVSGKT